MTDLFLSGGTDLPGQAKPTKNHQNPHFLWFWPKMGQTSCCRFGRGGTSQYIAKTLSGHFWKLKLYDWSVLKWGNWFAWSGKTDQKSPKSPFLWFWPKMGQTSCCRFGRGGHHNISRKHFLGMFWKLILYDWSVLKWGNWFAWSGKTDQKSPKSPFLWFWPKNGSNIVLQIWACGRHHNYIAKTLSGHFWKLKLYDGSVLKWGNWFAWSGKTDQKSPKSPFFVILAKNGSNIVLQIWACGTSQYIAKTLSGHFWKLKLYDGSVLKWGDWFAWSGKTDQKSPKSPFLWFWPKMGQTSWCRFGRAAHHNISRKHFLGIFWKLKLYDGSVLKWGHWFAWSGKTDQKSPKSPFLWFWPKMDQKSCCRFGRGGHHNYIAKTLSGHFWKLKLYDWSVLKWGNWFAWSGKTDQKSPKSPFFVILAKNGSNIVLQIWACGTSQYIAKTLSGHFWKLKLYDRSVLKWGTDLPGQAKPTKNHQNPHFCDFGQKWVKHFAADFGVRHITIYRENTFWAFSGS